MSGRSSWLAAVLAVAFGATLTGCGGGGSQPIRVTGSSTVHPFTQMVGEAFAKQKAGRQAPSVDSLGTGPGIAAFCAGGGSDTPDIADASRRMTKAEFATCQKNGVGQIVEVRIGLDGIVLATATAEPKLTLDRKDIYLALAATPMGKPNTARTWRDVNPRLPAVPIKVIGPAATSGTHDQFVELLMEPGCFAAMPSAHDLQAKNDPSFATLCRTTRTDGAYVVGGEDYGATVKAVAGDPQAVGVLGYSYLEANAATLRGLPVDGVAPEQTQIASGKYPGGRTLFLYVKRAHLKDKPELQAFLNLYATMWHPGGLLTRHGLIAMSEGMRLASQNAITNGEPMDGEALF